MNRIERWLFGLLGIMALGLWAFVGLRFITVWQTPLGPGLGLDTPISARATITAPPPAGPTNTLIPGNSTLTPIIIEPDNTPKCGGPLTMTILAVGSDTRASGYLYGLADVIRLVRVDFATPRITVLEFPRDLWVEIPEISSNYGITHGKLNQSYLYGNRGMGYYKGPGEGPGLLARTLDLNFGARPDHYIAVNMQTFVRFVDAIGGIDVFLPDTVDARQADQQGRWDLYFKAGPHHLKGNEALMLARIRTGGVFERANQQNLVLCAVRDALLNPYNLARTPDIIAAFDGAVQTDLTPEQLSQLACLAPLLEPHNIQFASFPQELLRGTRTYDIGVEKEVFIWEADFQILSLLVQSFQSGNWPARSAPNIETVTPGGPSTGTSFSCP